MDVCVLFKMNSSGKSFCLCLSWKDTFLFDFHYGFVKLEWNKSKKRKSWRWKTDSFIWNRFLYFFHFRLKTFLPTRPTPGEKTVKNKPRKQNNNENIIKISLWGKSVGSWKFRQFEGHVGWISLATSKFRHHKSRLTFSSLLENFPATIKRSQRKTEKWKFAETMKISVLLLKARVSSFDLKINTTLFKIVPLITETCFYNNHSTCYALEHG